MNLYIMFNWVNSIHDQQFQEKVRIALGFKSWKKASANTVKILCVGFLDYTKYYKILHAFVSQRSTELGALLQLLQTCYGFFQMPFSFALCDK